MNLYTLRQTYTNHQTGEHWTRLLSHRHWRTRRAAQQVGKHAYSWQAHNMDGTKRDESRVDVVELSQGGAL